MHWHANGPEDYNGAPKTGRRPSQLKAILAQVALISPDNPGRQDDSQSKLQN